MLQKNDLGYQFTVFHRSGAGGFDKRITYLFNRIRGCAASKGRAAYLPTYLPTFTKK